MEVTIFVMKDNTCLAQTKCPIELVDVLFQKKKKIQLQIKDANFKVFVVQDQFSVFTKKDGVTSFRGIQVYVSEITKQEILKGISINQTEAIFEVSEDDN